jgi:hypothetical protein
MKATDHSAEPLHGDPFQERGKKLLRTRHRVLGGDFEFLSESAALIRLVQWAYRGVPAHRLRPSPPHIAVRLVLGGRMRRGSARPRSRADEPGALAMLSAPGLLCGAAPETSMAVISAAQRSALIVVAHDLLGFPYHVRYELIELAAFTLAARAQGLMPLHAACIGQQGQGLLLIGDSGAGKSTAVLHGALLGLEVVAEDSLFVSPRTLRATGVANFLHVTGDALHHLTAADARLIRRAPIIRRRSGVRKFEVDLRQGRFRLAPQPLTLSGLVSLSARGARGKPLLVPLEPRAALQRLRACQPYAAAQPGWAAFIERMRHLPAFELRRGGHPRESAMALKELLRARMPASRRC